MVNNLLIIIIIINNTKRSNIKIYVSNALVKKAMMKYFEQGGGSGHRKT